MKKLAMAAAALLVLLGFTGCDVFGTTGSGDSTANSNVSAWKIKGSFDGWKVHNLTIDEIDSNKITYQISGLYRHPTIPIIYKFVLMDPSGKEYKATGADGDVTSVTPGTSFTLGDSSVAGSTTRANVGFEAAKDTYTVTVNIGTATAPSVNLIGGAADATEVTNAILAEKLLIKGDAFTVGWEPPTAGTYDPVTTTVSFDVTHSNKNGSFGFDSLDDFLKGVTINLTNLTAGGPGTIGQTLLANGSNAALTNAPKANAVYTISVLIDMNQTVANGRYTISAKLKTASDTDWAFEPWTSVFLNGQGLGSTVPEWGSTSALTITDDVASFTFVADTANVSFKPSKQTGWGQNVGFGGITVGAGSLPLDDNGNIHFSSTIGNTYRISVAFTGTYLADGKPIVTATDLGVVP